MAKNVKVLMLSENFYPLSTASAQRAFAYAKTLVLHSYETTVITKSRASFKSRKMTVISLNPKREIPIFDPIVLILYLLKSITIIRKHSIDLIISTVPKINNAFAGFLISKLLRVPHIIDVRDFWESSLFSYPLIRIIPKPLAYFLVKIVSLLYQEASSLITVNQTLKNILTKRGMPQNKVYLIPNGADTSTFRSCADEKCNRQLRKKYGLPSSKLLFVYGGSLTLDYRFDVLLRAIKHVKDKDFMFLLVGNPTLLRTNESILQTVRKLHLEKTVKVMGPLPLVKLAEVLRCCDVGVIPLDDKELLRHVITAKVFAYLASGLPILASGPKDGELESFLSMYHVGFFIGNATPLGFAEGIMKFLQMKPKIKDIGLRGRKIMEKHYDRYALSRRIIEVIQHTINSYRPSKVKLRGNCS